MRFSKGDIVKPTAEHARVMFRADRPNRERYEAMRGTISRVISDTRCEVAWPHAATPMDFDHLEKVG